MICFSAFFHHSFAVLGSMNSAIEVKDTPSEDLPLDEDYLGKLCFYFIIMVKYLLWLFISHWL